jgi:hypothetical protein
LKSKELCLNIPSKTQKVLSPSSKTTLRKALSAPSEQHYSTFLSPGKQAMLWRKVCGDIHTSCQRSSMTNAWVNSKYLRKDLFLLKGHYAKKVKLSLAACSLSHWQASEVPELRGSFLLQSWSRDFQNFIFSEFHILRYLSCYIIFQELFYCPRQAPLFLFWLDFML